MEQAYIWANLAADLKAGKQLSADYPTSYLISISTVGEVINLFMSSVFAG